MDMKKPIYCSLAFGSASINSYGEYIPCCSIRTNHFEMFKDSFPNHPILNARPSKRINASNLQSVRRELMKGEWPLACLNCKVAEDSGVSSMRMIWNRSIEVPMTDIVDPINIKYLDLTFGTKCNSKCMTCNADLSDFWEEEWIAIHGSENYVSRNRISINGTNAQQLLEDFPNVEFISLVGGEPTISEEHLLFLKLLIESGRSKNISLSYVTNLTGLTDELLGYWEHFKAVNTCVSIDGYGKVNEYIRYPFKWSKTETNLKKYLELCQKNVGNMKYTLGLSCTLSMYNAIQAPDLLEYWYDTLKTYKTEDGTLLKNVGAFINRVSFPVYAMVNNLPLPYRKQGIEKVDRLLAKIESEGLEVERGIIESIQTIKSTLEEEWDMDMNRMKEAKHFIKTSDQFRNRDMKDYIPELAEELEKIWKLMKL